MDEILIRVTEDDEILGPIPRSHVHGHPEYIHRSVHIMVLHPDGKLLLQKRSMIKDTQPGKWDTSVGGHVGFGQSYLEAAQREGEEELGFLFQDLRFLYSTKIRDSVESENIQTFLAINAGPFIHHPDEIDEIRFWSKAEILEGLGKEIFTTNFEEEFATFLQSPQGFLLK